MNTALAEERLVLGLDVGTQSLRAALVDLQGRTVAFGVAPIETTYPRPDLGRAGPRASGGWRPARRSARRWPRRAPRPSRSSAIGLDCTACTVARLRPRRQAAPPRPALDGPAVVPRGRRHQRDRRPGPPLRLGPGLSRVDAAQGPLAQAQRARDLPPGRPDRRVHRLDDVPADRPVDPLAEPRGREVELRPARRRLAARR